MKMLFFEMDGTTYAMEEDSFDAVVDFIKFFNITTSIKEPENLEGGYLIIQDYFHCSMEEAKRLDPIIDVVFNALLSQREKGE